MLTTFGRIDITSTIQQVSRGTDAVFSSGAVAIHQECPRCLAMHKIRIRENPKGELWHGLGELGKPAPNSPRVPPPTQYIISITSDVAIRK
jgi:hypothetical protein